MVPARDQLTCLGDVGRDNGNFSQTVQEVVQPSRQKGAAGRRQIEPGDGAQLDGQALQENGKDVAQQDDEEQLETIGRSGGDVGGVISRVNCCCQSVS